MKVILNKDLAPLGEEGDVKDVAKGYARNFLFPRGIALPYNEKTVKLFESRREEIEARKVVKRNDAAGLKEKLENLNLEISMPAGANGKLYGAVTTQTIVDELNKHGFQIERKRVELPGANIKSVGKYKLLIKLYESAAAELSVSVIGQEIKTETRSAGPARQPRKRRDFSEQTPREAGTDEAKPAPASPEAPSREEVTAQEAASPVETAEGTSAQGEAAQEVPAVETSNAEQSDGNTQPV